MTGFLTGADGNRISVFDGMVVGRVHGCDLVVDDTKVSRKHARLIVAGGVAEIEDLGSSNGTLLNGKLVARRVLRDGDEVVFGSALFRYSEGGAEAPPQPVARPTTAAVTADDDVDLFASPPPTPPPPRPAAAPKPPPPAAMKPVPAPPIAAPATPPVRTVVEFADEVVEVKPAQRPAALAAPSPGGPQLQRQQRVLQFSRNKDSKQGPLGDDLAQISSGNRVLIYLALAAGFAAVVFAIVKLMG